VSSRSGRQPSLPAPASKRCCSVALSPARGGSRSARSPPARARRYGPRSRTARGEGRSPWRCRVVSTRTPRGNGHDRAARPTHAPARLDNVDRPLSTWLWTALLLAGYGRCPQLQPAANRRLGAAGEHAAGGTTHRTPEASLSLAFRSACSRSSIRSGPSTRGTRRRYPPLVT
jgi:hypothetical protein